MTVFYSPSLHAFFDEAIHGARLFAEPQSPEELAAGKRPRLVANPDTLIPDDALPVTVDEHLELLAAQSAGKAIAWKSGRLVTVDPVPDPEEALARRRAQRDRLLVASDWTQLPDSPLDAIARQAWAQYRQALRDLDMSGTDWPGEPEF